MLQQAGQSRAQWLKGPANVDRVVLCVVAAVATPPSNLLLPVVLTS
jgi:hypothetical protein